MVAEPIRYRAVSRRGVRSGSKQNPAVLRVARSLVAHPAVYFVAYSPGRYDIIIAVHFDTINRLTHFVSTELTAIQGISNSETWIMAYPRKYYNFHWPNPNTFSQDEIAAGDDNYSSGHLNREIMDILMKDVRVSPSIIGSKLGISDRIIHKRLKSMYNNNVLTKQIVMNPQILENQCRATMGIVINKRNAHEIIDIILENPQIYLASVSLGRFNVVIAGHFHDMDILNEFVTHELSSIEGISSIETFVHNKPLKWHNVSLLDSQDWVLQPAIEKK